MSAVSPLLDPAPYLQTGLDAGLDAVGVAGVEPFESTRVEIERRRADGLNAGMAFTFRNPARSTDPRVTMPEAEALVVAALRYDHLVPPQQPDLPSGRVARYSWVDHYSTLRHALGEVARHLTDHGWKARVLADDNALVDRAAAHRAGIGWFGKNANILLPGQGSWCVLGSVLTDAPLQPASDVVPDACGTCTRCIDACPTNAIVAPGVVDARRCLAWLVQAPGPFPHEHREALAGRIYGCDDCQEVCPPNRREVRRGTAEVVDDPSAEGWVPLAEILEATDEELLNRHGRWYIPQRNPAYLRRNALLGLANTGDPGDHRVVAQVAQALQHPDPIVRSHAVWAARRIGRPDLLDRVAGDTDPMVRDELAAASPQPRAGFSP